MSQILIVEDEAIIRSALRRLLERSQYEVAEAGSVNEAFKSFQLSDFDLIITDLRLPGEPGTELIKMAEGVPVLVMTSYASLKSAVDAMRCGASDYIAKPFDHDEMLQAVARILENPPAKTVAREESEPTPPNDDIIGQCPAMRMLFDRIHKVAPTDSTVLIVGESGTGKELVAKALHESSERTGGPLISVNCAAIPDSLIESELFGHEKGAFTGANNMRKGLVEAADGGTLFLDEIGELPMEAQARLLRLIQEKEVRRVGSVQARNINVRLVAATHRDLKSLSKIGKFREDLYYRLHVVELRLPPLRERGSDVEMLANKLLARTAEKMHRDHLVFSPSALKAIKQYDWPGNVRELENAIERAVILCDGDIIEADLLSIEPDPHNIDPAPNTDPYEATALAAQARPANDDVSPSVEDPQEDLSLEDYFQRFVLEHQDAMTETELAQKLGISRKCLWERRQRLGIPRKKASKSPPSAKP